MCSSDLQSLALYTADYCMCDNTITSLSFGASMLSFDIKQLQLKWRTLALVIGRPLILLCALMVCKKYYAMLSVED